MLLNKDPDRLYVLEVSFKRCQGDELAPIECGRTKLFCMYIWITWWSGNMVIVVRAVGLN